MGQGVVIVPGASVPGAGCGAECHVPGAWCDVPSAELRPGEIATAVDMLLNHQQLTVQDAEAVAAAAAHFRTRPSLGFSDCLVLEVARKAGQSRSDRSTGTLRGWMVLNGSDGMAARRTSEV